MNQCVLLGVLFLLSWASLSVQAPESKDRSGQMSFNMQSFGAPGSSGYGYSDPYSGYGYYDPYSRPVGIIGRIWLNVMWFFGSIFGGVGRAISSILMPM